MCQNVQNLTFKPKFPKIGGTPTPKFYIFRELRWRSITPENLVFLSPEMSDICGKTFLAIMPNLKCRKTHPKKRSCVIVLDTPSQVIRSAERGICPIATLYSS